MSTLLAQYAFHEKLLYGKFLILYNLMYTVHDLELTGLVGKILHLCIAMFCNNGDEKKWET